MLSSSCSSRPRGTTWRYCTDRIALQRRRAQEQEPRPSFQGRDAQKNGNCTRNLFLCHVDRKSSWLHSGIAETTWAMSWVDKGATSCFAQMPTQLSTLPSRSVQLRSRLASLPAQACDWSGCTPRTHCQASTGQPCLLLHWKCARHHFFSDCLLSPTLDRLLAPRPCGKWICKGGFPLWGLSGGAEPGASLTPPSYGKLSPFPCARELVRE